MKTLDLEIFGSFALTVDEMIVIKGGDESDGDPSVPPTVPPVKI